MNFLAMCQELRNRAPGIGGTAGQPATVANQTGDMGNVVAWIRDAWVDVQALHPGWLFMRSEFSATVPAGTLASTASDLGVSDLADWDDDTIRSYLVSQGAAGDTFLLPWDHPVLRDTYRFGVQTLGAPAVFAVRPRDKALMLGPAPASDVVVYGEYVRSPQVLAANADTPTGIPDWSHMIIVYWAMTKHAGHEAAPDIMADARNQLATLLWRLEQDYLPKMTLGGPLA